MPGAGRGARRRDAGVFGFDLAQRALERGDLPAQPAPALGLVVAGLACGGRRHVQRGGDLARVHAGVVRFARGVRGDRGDRRELLWRGRDERAAALLAVDQALLLEALVDGARRCSR